MILISQDKFLKTINQCCFILNAYKFLECWKKHFWFQTYINKFNVLKKQTRNVPSSITFNQLLFSKHPFLSFHCETQNSHTSGKTKVWLGIWVKYFLLYQYLYTFYFLLLQHHIIILPPSSIHIVFSYTIKLASHQMSCKHVFFYSCTSL